MDNRAHHDQSPVPVAIGGVGGSGTRLVAQVVQALGVHLGDDLNQALDNLWFTLLFKRIEALHCSEQEFDRLTRALVSGLTGGQPPDDPLRQLVENCAVQDREQHPAKWLGDRAASLLDAAARPSRSSGTWGWKEPNTHLFIERLWQRLPTLRYIHVVRHGLDMAYSRNQNQLQLWGEQVLGEDGPITPARSLAYWCCVHQRMQQLLADNPERMYWLDYDALCREPERILGDLCVFLDIDASQAQSLNVPVVQQAPRHTSLSIDALAPENVAYVRSLGYIIQNAR